MINLKEIRKSKGLTQQELAHLLGMKQQQYSRYEIEENQIPLKIFIKIIKICDCEIQIKKRKQLSK